MQIIKVRTELATVTIAVKDKAPIDDYQIELYALEALELVTQHINGDEDIEEER